MLSSAVARRVEQPRGEKPGEREHERAETVAVQDRPLGRDGRLLDVRDTRQRLQRDAGEERELALLAEREPHERRTLQRPRGRRPARIECERDGDGHERDAERKLRFDEHA